MKKIMIFCAVLLSFVAVNGADEWIECSEKGFKGHVQGIAADESGIYWSFYNILLKTDYTGKKLASRTRHSHMGDLCVVDGKIYVAFTVYGNRHLPDYDNWRGWVLVFDAGNLKYLGRHKTESPGSDGIAFLNGKFYVGAGGVREYHPQNEILIYDRDFKFLQKVTVDIGQPTRYGVQTMNAFNGKLLTSFYGDSKKKSYIFDPDDFSKVAGTFPVRTSFGMAEVPEKIAGAKNVYLIARNTGKKRDWSAKLRVVQYVDGKLIPFKLPAAASAR